MSKQYLITEDNFLAIQEAADILRNLAKGHGATDEEARNACMGLLSIVPVEVPNGN